MAIQSFDFSTGKAIDSSKRKVITCEYEMEDLSVLSKIIRSKKFQIAGKGGDERSLLELARKHKSGMMFLDINATGFDAFEVLNKVKNTYKEFMVILTSDDAGEETVKKAIMSGADGFAVKPFQAESIKKVMDKFDE